MHLEEQKLVGTLEAVAVCTALEMLAVTQILESPYKNSKLFVQNFLWLLAIVNNSECSGHFLNLN